MKESTHGLVQSAEHELSEQPLLHVSHTTTGSCFQFIPISGPTRGGTKITITGQQFGNYTAALKVTATVALEDCAIDYSNATQ